MTRFGRRVARRWAWTAFAGVLAAAAPTAARAVSPSADEPCRATTTPMSVEGADELIANRYRLPPHPAVALPADPTWEEDPLGGEKNWLFQFHSLWYVENLWLAWRETGDPRYLERYLFLLRDWWLDNPVDHPRSPWSWNDMGTAIRGMTYACAVRHVGEAAPWLVVAARQHAGVLADPDFYVGVGNHALKQATALLDLGCTLADSSWRDLGARRIESLARRSIDGQGVTNEQSDGYQSFNWSLYSDAIERLRACGVEPSRELVRRVALMPRFMAWAATPSGRTAMIGDTGDQWIAAPPGSEAEFVASGGRAGRRPSDLFTVWRAGYASFRSGWGKTRPPADETAVLVRFGPGRYIHGHDDAASVVLDAYGDRVLLDPGGPYRYRPAEKSWRDFFRSERAHNTVVVDGLEMRKEGSTDLVAHGHSPEMDFIALRHSKIPGVLLDRRLVYWRSLKVLLVEDDLRSAGPVTFRQLWHLHPDARPELLARGGFWTGRSGGPNAMALQLVGGKSQSVVRGSADPIQGWISPGYGRKVPAPVVEVASRGTRARYVTLIVPVPGGRPRVEVMAFSVDPRGGFDLTLEVGGQVGRISVRARGARGETGSARADQ
ncbi:MAG: alginate lyase family protein [Acidobacteria bacterium]|nr:alginate lyase family protein [Acidobacteriota bacterium]